MPPDEHSDQEPRRLQSASEAAAVIRNDCRAARIGEVTDFAECLVKTDASCPHRFAFNAFRYCAHPQREAIIARTPAHQGPLGK
jgi:hypothetical protein